MSNPNSDGTDELRKAACQIAATYFMACTNDCVSLTKEIVELVQSYQPKQPAPGAVEGVDDIDQILTGLTNFLVWEGQQDWEDAYPRDANRKNSQDRAKAALQAREHRLIKAYGGCTNCYGKGYATVNGQWSGTDTDQDIGSSGGRVSGGNPFEMKFCTCARGKQLKTLIEKYLTEGEADE